MGINAIVSGGDTRHGQELLNDIVMLFGELLGAAGASKPMLETAYSRSLESAAEAKSSVPLTELGSLRRDCMEVMCAWRRHPMLVDDQGEPRSLAQDGDAYSFQWLCQMTSCDHNWQEVLSALLAFGSIELDGEMRVVSRTPTFLVARSEAGGLLATDGLIKQLEGFLRVLHRNVLSASGSDRSRFERACTVAVPIELEPIFDRLVRDRGQEFVDSIDEWLERNSRRESTSGRYIELGVGAYFIHLGERLRRPLNAASRQVARDRPA